MKFYYIMNSFSTYASIAQWWSTRLLTDRLQVRALLGAPRRLRLQSFLFVCRLEPKVPPTERVTICTVNNLFTSSQIHPMFDCSFFPRNVCFVGALLASVRLLKPCQLWQDFLTHSPQLGAPALAIGFSWLQFFKLQTECYAVARFPHCEHLLTGAMNINGFFCLVLFIFNSSFFTFHKRIYFEIKVKSEKVKAYLANLFKTFNLVKDDLM